MRSSYIRECVQYHLQIQVATLFCYLLHTSQIACHRLLDAREVFLRPMYQRIEHFLHNRALEAQNQVTFGVRNSPERKLWDDAKCDEAQLRRNQIKVKGSDRGRMSWPGIRWGAIQRGTRKTLVLEELPARTASLRVPGRGPITTAEWVRLGNKWFKNRCVFVSRDSAKAYLAKISSTRHDYIAHGKKKLLKGLQSQPVFSKNARHVLPNNYTSVNPKASALRIL